MLACEKCGKPSAGRLCVSCYAEQIAKAANPRREATKTEADIAKEVGGRLVAGSGSPKGCGGDVTQKAKFTQDGDGWSIDRGWLIESKRTDKQSISVKASVVQQIVSQAGREGKRPCLVLDVGGFRLYCILRDDFLELAEK